MKPTREEVLKLMRQASGGILTQVAEDPRFGYEIKVEELQTFAELLQAANECGSVPDERTKFEAWSGNRLSGNDKFFAWEAWFARASLGMQPHNNQPNSVHVAGGKPEGAVASPLTGSEPDERVALYRAAMGDLHDITTDEIVLYRDGNKPGNALSQLADRLEAAHVAPDADEITADQCIELECALQKEWARKAIAETRAAASLLEHVEFRSGMETACDEIETRLGLTDQSGISSPSHRPNEKDVVGEGK